GANVSLRSRRPGARVPLGVELLRPTRSYVAATEALADLPGVHGFAHLSGGGVRNLPRLGQRLGFELDAWPSPPAVFRWLQQAGRVADAEMFQTFNMGIGFVVVVDPSATTGVERRLRRAGVRDGRWIGRVTPPPGVRLPRWGLNYRSYA